MLFKKMQLTLAPEGIWHYNIHDIFTKEKQNMNEIWASLQTSTLSRLLPTIVLLAVGVLVIKMVLKIIDRSLNRSKLEKAGQGLLKSLTKVVLYLLLGMMAASMLGIDVSGVLALTSVATLAVSLGLQDALANVIGGFTLLSNHPFKAGDYVEISGQAGSVLTLDIMYTKLATFDNKIISIPNSSVVTSQIINYSTSGTRRVDISIKVAYGSNPADVKAALLQAAQVPTVNAEPAPFAGLKNYGESTAEYVLQVWTDSSSYWPTLFAINERIPDALHEVGADFSYPHMNVHLNN